jgi:hypothetical protein
LETRLFKDLWCGVLIDRHEGNRIDLAQRTIRQLVQKRDEAASLWVHLSQVLWEYRSAINRALRQSHRISWYEGKLFDGALTKLIFTLTLDLIKHSDVSIDYYFVGHNSLPCDICHGTLLSWKPTS